ncbi:hypothetical protein GQ457_06G000870 [Hibiscus cannabinus]
MCALFWCKALIEDAFRNDKNWWRKPLLCFIPYWSSPSLGEMKFNADCGGVLRTSEGEIRTMFSEPILIFEADFAVFIEAGLNRVVLFKVWW